MRVDMVREKERRKINELYPDGEMQIGGNFSIFKFLSFFELKNKLGKLLFVASLKIAFNFLYQPSSQTN